MLEYCKNVFLRPHLGLNTELQKASLGKALLNMLVAAVITAVLFVLGSWIGTVPPMLGQIYATVLPSIPAPYSFAVLEIPFLLVAAVLSALVLFVLGRLVGGNGSFTALLYGNSLVYIPISILMVLMLIPVVGFWIWMVVSFLASLYAVYFMIIVLKRSQNLSLGRTLIALAVYFILIIVVAAIVAVVVAWSLLTQGTGIPPTETAEGNFVPYSSTLHGGYQFLYPNTWERTEISQQDFPVMGGEFFDMLFFKTSPDQNVDNGDGVMIYVMPDLASADPSFKSTVIACDKDYFSTEMGTGLDSSLDGSEIQGTSLKNLGNGQYCFVTTAYAGEPSGTMVMGLCKDRLPIMAVNPAGSAQTEQELEGLLTSFSC